MIEDEKKEGHRMCNRGKRFRSFINTYKVKLRALFQWRFRSISDVSKVRSETYVAVKKIVF